MSGVEIRQNADSEGQRGGRKGQEEWPTPLYRASWSTDIMYGFLSILDCQKTISLLENRQENTVMQRQVVHCLLKRQENILTSSNYFSA